MMEFALMYKISLFIILNKYLWAFIDQRLTIELKINFIIKVLDLE